MKYSMPKALIDNDDLAQVAWDAIEPIWDDIPLSSSKKLAQFMDELTVGQKALISIDWCQKEIRNGGMKQLLCNSTGNLIPYAVNGFKRINAEVYADVLQEVVSLFGGDFPMSGNGRKKVIKTFSDEEKKRMAALDEIFFDYIFSEDHELENYRGNYVKQNPQEFCNS